MRDAHRRNLGGDEDAGWGLDEGAIDTVVEASIGWVEEPMLQHGFAKRSGFGHVEHHH